MLHTVQFISEALVIPSTSNKDMYGVRSVSHFDTKQHYYKSYIIDQFITANRDSVYIFNIESMKNIRVH